MTTPAGWYDDGSGRQRWWDGEQWTEHFAPQTPDTPEASAADAPAVTEAPASADPAVPEAPSVDDTVIRPSDEPEASATGQDWSASPAVPGDSSDPSASAVNGETAATTPLGDDLAGYSAPAAPVYPVAAAGQPASGYPGAAPAYGDAYSGSPSGYPAAAPYPQPGAEAPKKISVLGLVGLGLSALGTILAFIPLIGFVGFILLGAGFIVSLISLFLKGKKWPGIAGLILSVIGGIISAVMFFVFFLAIAHDASEELNNQPSSSPSIEATEPSDTDEGTTGTGRPTVEELEVGIAAIIEETGAEGYTPAHITCFAEAFAASDIDDETLRVIASGDDATFSDPDVALAFTDTFSEALPTCLVP
ncbi:DUF2510 domain-containing protein [Microbacterium sp. MYb66]|uniref:DUF2510 domain-containing protein n=1 Tax=Microbacterium sp. MYb66 TaxID=1848692 RepID=UPI000CFFD747|nr:DUF2510 domain-containing protein [Microbacterium sp. MYb66]PRA78645.1 hypothetical protein CQ045_17995 [Microbacterium sp. MYb66]